MKVFFLFQINRPKNDENFLQRRGVVGAKVLLYNIQKQIKVPFSPFQYTLQISYTTIKMKNTLYSHRKWFPTLAIMQSYPDSKLQCTNGYLPFTNDETICWKIYSDLL